MTFANGCATVASSESVVGKWLEHRSRHIYIETGWTMLYCSEGGRPMPAQTLHTNVKCIFPATGTTSCASASVLATDIGCSTCNIPIVTKVLN